MKRGPRSSESEQSHDNSNSEEVGGMARGAGSKRTPKKRVKEETTKGRGEGDEEEASEEAEQRGLHVEGEEAEESDDRMEVDEVEPKENEKAGEDNMNLIASPKDSQQEVPSLQQGTGGLVIHPAPAGDDGSSGAKALTEDSSPINESLEHDDEDEEQQHQQMGEADEKQEEASGGGDDEDPLWDVTIRQLEELMVQVKEERAGVVAAKHEPSEAKDAANEEAGMRMLEKGLREFRNPRVRALLRKRFSAS